MSSTSPSHRRRRVASAALLAFATLAAGCRREAPPGANPSSATSGPRRIVALGRLQPAGGVVEIRSLPTEIVDRFGNGMRDPDAEPAPGYGVVEGLKVQSGCVLAWLKSYDLRQTHFEAIEKKFTIGQERRVHELALAEAQVDQAEVGVAQAEAKLKEVASQQVKVDALALVAESAAADVAKLAELRAADPELVTELQYQRQASQAQIAKAEYAAAAAMLPHAVEAARKAVDAAATNRKLAEANLDLIRKVDANEATKLELKGADQSRDQSLLRAPEPADGPVDYTVLEVSVEPGEAATQLPVLQLADLSEMACIAEVYEADAKHVRDGQAATIQSAAFAAPFDVAGGGLKGVVERVGNLVASPGLTNRNPLAPSDRSVIQVRIKINDPRPGAVAQAARLVGMQATVEFTPVADEAAPPKAGD